MMTNRENCTTCQYFEITGVENYYNVGKCKHPVPQLGGAMVRYENTAEWLSCYQHKRKVIKKVTAKVDR
jgi:hypothetical protein